MRTVIRPVARAAALLVVAPFLTFVSALATEHVHEPEPGHDHEHAVVHTHFAPHHVEVPATEHRPPAADQDLDHDDEHVVWLASSTLHESPYHVHYLVAAVAVSSKAVPIERDWSVTPFDDAAPLHGPPRQPSLRGPPPTV
jgi:hypothetical protein